MIAGPRTTELIELGAGLDHHPALDARRVVDLPSIAVLDRVEHEPVAVEERVLLAGVDPPALRAPRDAPRCPWSISHWIASVISSSPRADGSIARTASWMRGVEEVDADEREVGRRVGGLLDQPHDVAVRVDLGDAELRGVVDVREQDLRGGCRPRRPAARRLAACVRSRSRSTNVAQALLQHVVAEVHRRSRRRRGSRGDEHAVGEAERRVLGDVGDLDAELRAVADRGRDLVAGVADRRCRCP